MCFCALLVFRLSGLWTCLKFVMCHLLAEDCKESELRNQLEMISPNLSAKTSSYRRSKVDFGGDQLRQEFMGIRV